MKQEKEPRVGRLQTILYHRGDSCGHESDWVLQPSLFQGHVGASPKQMRPFNNHWVREICLFTRTT
jgi:hypothetical protein